MYDTIFDAENKVWSGAELNVQTGKRNNFGEYLLEKLGAPDSERVMQVNIKYSLSLNCFKIFC